MDSQNCIDGGCRSYGCLIHSDCSERERCSIRSRQGICFRRPHIFPQPPFVPHPQPPYHPPQRPPNRPPSSQSGFKLKLGQGPKNIPENVPCPFYTKPSDAFSSIKCERIFCRCNSGADCQAYKPTWANGPLKCCLGACLLAEGDGCQRKAACT